MRSESVFQSYMGDKAEFKSINTLRYFNTGDIFEVKGDYFFCKEVNNAVKYAVILLIQYLSKRCKKAVPWNRYCVRSLSIENSIIICFSRASSECYAKSEIDQRS